MAQSYPRGFAPSVSPTRALARRFAGALRSRGSLAKLARSACMWTSLASRFRGVTRMRGRARVAQVDRQSCALILSDQWPEKVGKGLMFISLNVEPETREAHRGAGCVAR